MNKKYIEDYFYKFIMEYKSILSLKSILDLRAFIDNFIKKLQKLSYLFYLNRQIFMEISEIASASALIKQEYAAIELIIDTFTNK